MTPENPTEKDKSIISTNNVVVWDRAQRSPPNEPRNQENEEIFRFSSFSLTLKIKVEGESYPYITLLGVKEHLSAICDLC